jgi:uncharacterized protein (TIGR02646 family)
LIKINKPENPPEVLLKRGKKNRRSHCTSYTRNRKKYDSGEKKFDFDSGIYGHKTVKQALVDAQYGKCCFCESRVVDISYGDVEHFRPKAAFRQDENDDLTRPGYYWLAYEWNNLFLSCQLCNQRYKKNLFPLADPNRRAESHKDDVSKERPLFADPSDDPEQHITFRKEIPVPVNGDKIGEITIRSLSIDRRGLNDERLDYYKNLRFVHIVAHADPPLEATRDAKAHLMKAVLGSSKYAAMARAAIAADFK